MIESIPIRIFEQLLGADRLNKADYLILMGDVLTNSDRFMSSPSKAYQAKWQKFLFPQLSRDSIPEDTAFSQFLDASKSEDLALEVIQKRSQLMRSVYADVLATLQDHQIQIESSWLLPSLWHYWLPLAQALTRQQEVVQRPFIQGLLGGQGTGKTTLGIILKVILQYLNKRFVSISIDDFYKTYTDRQKLRDHRPALIWRGPPSTHDIDLCCQTLKSLSDRQINQASQPIHIPRFDKALHNGAGDRIAPDLVPSPDIILFEGWFVGMHPLPINAFRELMPPILSESDRQFALQSNADLHSYLPIWQTLDSLIVLVPEDYRYCLQWRREAEHRLIISNKIALNQDKTGMGDREITEFVEYFWKALHPELFLPPLINPTVCKDSPHLNQYGFPYADWLIKIGRSHFPIAIHSISPQKI